VAQAGNNTIILVVCRTYFKHAIFRLPDTGYAFLFGEAIKRLMAENHGMHHNTPVFILILVVVFYRATTGVCVVLELCCLSWKNS